jgi:Bacterial protein of unknown function (Gcw_chp).
MKFPRLLLSLTAFSSAFAPTVFATNDEGTWSVTPAFASEYLFRGTRVAGAAFQPSLDYSRGAFAAGLWSSAAFSDRGRGRADPEFDVYGTYSISNDARTLDVVPGFWLYTYPDADRRADRPSLTFEPSLAVNVHVAGIRLTPALYYDVTLEGATWEISAAFALPLKRLGTTIEFLATAGTFKWDNVADASPPTKNWGDYYTLGARIPVTLTARSQLALGLTHSLGRNHFFKQGTAPKYKNPDAGNHTAVTLSYTFSP